MSSSKNSPNIDQEPAQNGTGQSAPDIIDAEIIRETADPQVSPPSGSASSAAPQSTGASKLGWISAGFMVAFAAGVYVAPKFDPGLVYLGLKPAPDAPVVVPRDQTVVDLTPLQSAAADLAAKLAAVETSLADHARKINDGAAARAKMNEDITLLAAGPDGTGRALSDPAVIAALQADISRLDSDIARLSSLSGADDPSVTQLTGALALARAETSALKSRLANLETAMQAVEAGALEASPRGRLVLALGRLKDRALLGQPFGAGLDALRGDFSQLPALDQQLIGISLAELTRAGSGITPYDVLVRDFDAVAAATVKAADQAEGSYLANLFSTRRTDASATGIDAVLVKAERALLARDLKGAVETLESISTPALDASAAWREQAQTHANVLLAFDRLVAGVADTGRSTSGIPSSETGKAS